MARKLLKDTCELAAEILDGKHDAELSFIEQACAARKKTMFRKGTKVRLVKTSNVNIDGKVGEVLKVNAKRISVGLGTLSYEDWDTARKFPTWSEGEFNVPADMLEIVPNEARAAFAKQTGRA